MPLIPSTAGPAYKRRTSFDPQQGGFRVSRDSADSGPWAGPRVPGGGAGSWPAEWAGGAGGAIPPNDDGASWGQAPLSSHGRGGPGLLPPPGGLPRHLLGGGASGDVRQRAADAAAAAAAAAAGEDDYEDEDVVALSAGGGRRGGPASERDAEMLEWLEQRNAQLEEAKRREAAAAEALAAAERAYAASGGPPQPPPPQAESSTSSVPAGLRPVERPPAGSRPQSGKRNESTSVGGLLGGARFWLVERTQPACPPYESHFSAINFFWSALGLLSHGVHSKRPLPSCASATHRRRPARRGRAAAAPPHGGGPPLRDGHDRPGVHGPAVAARSEATGPLQGEGPGAEEAAPTTETPLCTQPVRCGLFFFRP